MYCVNCGVKLADNEKQCPLCKTTVFHPELMREKGESLYPLQKYPTSQSDSKWPQIFISAAFLLPLLITLISDLLFSRSVTWSGFVIGGLFSCYVIFILPSWFKKPNPVIFVPCSFTTIGLYLLYISVATHGGWFLTFALPVVGGVGLIVTAVVALLWYVRRGKLYIFGGAAIALGAFIFAIEWLANYTFGISRFIGWSLYPLTTLAVVGGTMIFLAICRPARETMERKFFI